MRKLKLFSLLCLLLIGVGQMWATDPVSTLTFTAQAGGKGTADDGVKWTVTSDGTESSYDATKGIHFGTSSAQVTYIQLATSEISGTITKVVVNASTASGVTASASVTVGGSAFGGDAKSLSTSATNYTFEGSASGEIIVRVAKPSKAAKAIYVKSVAVTYTSGGGGADPVDPTITFEDGSVDVGYTLDLSTLFTSNSNGDVTYSITSGGTYATIEGSVLTGVAAGSVAVQASQAATASYNAATANSTITVNEHVVTAGTYSITFNNAFFGTTGLNGSLSGANLKNHSGTQNDITIEYQKGTGSNMYLKDSEIRLYNGNKLVVTAPTGFNITGITGLKSTMSANVGEIASTAWSGKANSVTLSHGSSSGNSALTTISVTYAAIAPEVTVDPASLSFTAKQNIAVDGKTFTLEGANLTSGLTLAASTGFTVSPTSLTAEAAMVEGGVEVTVTPATPTATTTPVEGTVTISGGGLSESVEVTLSMSVTETYAVAVAVNDNTMGSATINNGAGPVYAEYADDVNLVATPESGYEFVNWSASSDDIEIANATSATTTATIGAAGTITATFQAQACKNPKAPTLNGAVAVTYNSATINWNAVTQDTENNDIAQGGLFGYAVTIKQGENVIVNEDATDEVSYTKDNLAANTTYHYIIMSVGNSPAYCEESNPTLEGDFTTSDYPAATLSLVENGGTPYNWGSGLKLNSVIALPDELAGLGCSGKVLFGWTNDKDFADTDDDPTGEDYFWAAGEDYTIVSTADKLYAVLASGSAAGDTEVLNENFSGISTGNSTATSGSGSAWTPNSNFSSSASAVYQAGGAIRLGKSGSLTTKALDLSSGAVTVSFKMKGWATGEKTVTVQVDDQTAQSATSTSYIGSGNFESKSLTFAAGTTSSVVKFTTTSSVRVFVDDIVVSVAHEASFSDYTISCQAALPVLAAPTFDVAEGTYYAAQTITLTATDDADIYYTEDGSDPTTSSTKYTAPFTVDATKTIKAIAAKDGFETSEVAEATYTIGKTFASVSDLFTYLEAQSLTSLNNVKVTGLVSQIKSIDPSKYVNGQYYISDNGQMSNELYIHNGKYINGADFTADPACPLNVGDQVTVIGNYSLNNTTQQLNAGNSIVSRTAAEVVSVAIGGTAEKTTYSPEDNVFSRAGLTATATYNTGYTKDVTAEATWTNNLTENIVNANGKVEVTATYEGQSDMEEVSVTYTSKTLDHITLSYASTTTYVGLALPTPTVTASYVEDIAAEDVTELVIAANGFDTESKYDNTKAGTYTITVSYTLGEVTKSATYTVTVKSVYNSEAEPYTVAQALDIIGALFTTTTASSDSIVVAGKVSRLDGTYVNTYWISDDGKTNNELEVYSGKYLNKAAFTAQNQLHVGDEVVVKGKVKTYNSTKEFDSNSRLVSLAREVEVTVANVAELEVVQADLAVEDLTITTLSEGAVTLVSGDEAIATIVENKIHAVAAGNVTITANVAAAGIYKAASADFTVLVVAAKTRYTVSFDANGGEGDDPVIANQLPGATVDLPENPYSKENSAFKEWVVNDGAVEITDGHFTMPEGNVTIKAMWNDVETTRIIFNVNGNTDVIAAVDAPQTVKYDITQTADAISGYEFYGWAVAPQTADVTAAIDTIKSYTPQAGEDEDKVLYAVFKRTNVGDNKKYTLDYENESALASSSSWGSYGKSYAYTAIDGSVWTVKAYKNSGMQMNTGKDCSIKIPDCPAKIVSIKIACAQAKAVGLSASNYSGTGTITYIVSGTDATSQTLDFTNKEVTGGYIVPKGGSTVLTKIEVEYDGTEVYYTTAPAPVYNVTYDLGEGDWAENTGCEAAKVKAGLKYTICSAVPVRDHYTFTKWQIGGVDASGEITISGNTTITAVWAEKHDFALKYSDGAETISEAGDIEEGTVITLPAVGTGEGKINFSKSGYDFKGWKYNGKNYKAGASFTMPAEAVTFVAQWKKQNLEKLTLVTNASQLVAGSKVVFANQEASAVAGASASETNSFMESVAAEFNGDKSLITAIGTGIKMTLVQVADGWAFEYNGKYLAPYSGNKMAWYATPTAWTIVVDEKNNAKIENGENYAMRYNKAQNQQRFAAYGKTSCEPIQLYAENVAISETGTTNVSDLGNMDDEVIVVSGQGAVLNVDVAADSASYVAKNGATIQISAENNKATKSVIADSTSTIKVTKPTKVNKIFSVAATMGGGKSGQVYGSDMVEIAQSTEAYFDITLGANGTSAQWHAIAVPFPVDAINGIYDAATGEKLINEVNYAIMAYDGAIRATGAYGWKKYRQILQPGVFYLMTVDGDTKTFRFKMAGTVLPTGDNLKLNLHKYAASGDGQSTDAGWNSVANPTLEHGSINKVVYVLNPTSYTYEDKDPSTYNFIVGTPFFIQAEADESDVVMADTVPGKPYYAPRRVSEKSIENIKIFFGNEVYKDKLTISANEEALNEYQIGKDLVKMTMTNTPKVAQIFGNAYNAKMSRIYAPMSNDKAEYSLTLYAPEAGEYTISVPEMENAEIYLTKDGAIIWNLTMSEYTNDFAKGNNEGYGLLLIKKITGISTGVENIEAAEAGVQKVVIDDKVFILRGEKMYDVTGKMVK